MSVETGEGRLGEEGVGIWGLLGLREVGPEAPSVPVLFVGSYGSYPTLLLPPLPPLLLGKDTVIVAKLNGKELPAKPDIKWFKGKWLELGSKSGARFSFKESHDAASNVRTPWGGEGLRSRAGGCVGQDGRMSRSEQAAFGHGVCMPPRALRVRDVGPQRSRLPRHGRRHGSWPFLGELGEW